MSLAPRHPRARKTLAVVGWLALSGGCFLALFPVALIFFWSVGARHHPENYVGGAILFGGIGVALLVGIGVGLVRAFRTARGSDARIPYVLPKVILGVAAALALFFLLGILF